MHDTSSLLHAISRLDAVQELGQPILTMEAGIAAGSFYPADQESEDGAKRKEVGNVEAALAAAKNVIKGARLAPYQKTPPTACLLCTLAKHARIHETADDQHSLTGCGVHG